MPHEIIHLGPIELQWQSDIALPQAFQKHAAVIDEIWQVQKAKSGGTLHEGSFYNLQNSSVDGGMLQMNGHFLAYKYHIARRERPDLGLDLKPVGVSGITCINEGGNKHFLFAKRSNVVVQQPGFWELVPSGSLDQEVAHSDGSVDFEEKLRTESREEIGIPADHIDSFDCLGLVFDRQNSMYDVCCEIMLSSSCAEVLECCHVSDEYDSPRFVAEDELQSFVKHNQECIVPASIALIEAYRQAKSGSVGKVE